MSDHQSPGDPADLEYQEFARKMALFEDGPTTTRFEQLRSAGINPLDPDTIADDDLRTKLWQLLAELAKLRAYLDQTDHLSDRDLYDVLWRDVLREEVPAIDELGFNHPISLLSNGGEEETRLYLMYYADDEWRRQWQADFPDYVMPAPADPPFNRDCLLPRPNYAPGPEARAWLAANWSASAFATNRFGDTQNALRFVEQLYAAGASDVAIGGVMLLPNHQWTPYADTLIVELPASHEQRHMIFEVMESVGRPDERDTLGPLLDSGQARIRLWWD